MNQNRKDQDMPNRQSNMEQSEGSRGDDRLRGQDRGGSMPGSGRQGERAVTEDSDTFEQGGGADRSRHDSTERGTGPSRERNQGQGSGITNRGMDREQDEQDQLPERGRSQSER